MTLRSSSTLKKNANRTRPALEGWRNASSSAGRCRRAAAQCVGRCVVDRTSASSLTPPPPAATPTIQVDRCWETWLAPRPTCRCARSGLSATPTPIRRSSARFTAAAATPRFESIQNSQLIAAGASNSLSGVGRQRGGVVLAQPVRSDRRRKNQPHPGRELVDLDSIGADTQINLRTLPPPPTTTTTLPTSSLLVGTSTTGAAASTSSGHFATTTTTTSSANTTLEALQSTTVTNPYSVTTTYVSNGNGSQTLTGISGEFKSAGNIVEPLAAGQPIKPCPLPRRVSSSRSIGSRRQAR